jgi:hypothetical protein
VTASKIIDRILNLIGSRSTMLETEWDAINSTHDNALERAFGKLEKAKIQAFAKYYEKGQISATDRILLVSMLKPKLPKTKKVKDVPIPGTEKWGKKK